MASAKRESALVLAFPELEGRIGELRRELDPTASFGMPPHVTLLYPFVDPDEIDLELIGRIRGAAQGIPPFDLSFEEVKWFGDEVMWLAPVPGRPVLDLISRLTAAFPEHPPYGGAFEPVPHLTIGASAPLHRLEAAAELAVSWLPLEARAATISLVVGMSAGDGWRVADRIDLEGASDVASHG